MRETNELAGNESVYRFSDHKLLRDRCRRVLETHGRRENEEIKIGRRVSRSGIGGRRTTLALF